jgi:glycosyltransferase involved in cell wall biosynthesis
MKILVITSRDLEKSSTKYRIAQYTDFFNSKGIRIEFIKRKALNPSLIKNFKSFDVVLNQRCLIKASLSKKIFSHSKRTIFDFDDAIFTRSGKAYSLFTSLRVKRRFRLWLRYSDVTTTANHYLADIAKKISPSVVIVPMALDMNMWKPACEKTRNYITMGWAGAPVNIPNIEGLNDIFSKLINKYPFLKLAIFSGEKPHLTCPFEFIPYQKGKEPEFVQNLDIGLLPLAEDEFSKGKSPIKAIQYLACGIPVVGNVFGATAEILKEDNSIAASFHNQWFQALETLINDKSRREMMGQTGRKHVLKHYNILTVQEQLLNIIMNKRRAENQNK